MQLMGKNTANKSVQKGRPNLTIKSVKDKRIVDAVLMAAFQGDEAALAHFNITARTLSRYRKRTLEVAELSEIVSYRMKELEDTGALDKVEGAINKGLEAFERACAEARFSDPDSITAMATWFDVLANYDLTRKMLHARLQGIS